MADPGYNYTLGKPYGGIPGYGGVPAYTTMRYANTLGGREGGSDPNDDWSQQRAAQGWVNNPGNSYIPKYETGALADMQARTAQAEVVRQQKITDDAAAARDVATQKKIDAEIARQKAREAEQDRLQREAEERRIAKENVERESAFDSMARWAEERGMDPNQIRTAFKTLGKYDYGNEAKLLATVRATQTWADRFGAVQKARDANGWNYMSEDQILKQEDDYRAALSQFGLPKSFYDTKEDFQSWIANDVSVAEVTDRAKMASSMADGVDPGTKDAFKQYWGIGQGDLTAYFLDRNRTLDTLQKQSRAAELASESNMAGIGGLNAGLFEEIAGEGTERGVFRKAAEATGVTQEDWKRLAQVGGENLTQASLLNANLGRDVTTEKKLGKLASQERGRFAGSGGGTAALGSSSVGAY